MDKLKEKKSERERIANEIELKRKEEEKRMEEERKRRKKKEKDLKNKPLLQEQALIPGL